MYSPISLGPRYSVQMKKNGMGRLYSTHGVRRFACKVFMGKPSGERSLGRSRHRWQDNTKMDLKKWDLGHRMD
jgi:hypothetical protein